MDHLDGLHDIAGDYDGFVVDLWGVVHNGVHLLPGVTACLRALRDGGKRVVFLSNAPRRAAIAADGLRRMGIEDALYDGVVTSGEVTRTLLLERTHPFVAPLGDRVFHLGPPKDANVLEGAGLVTVPLGDADFVLNTGPDDDNPGAVDTWRPLLDAARARDLPMICANPDLEVVRGTTRVICAGLLARIYRDELGGRVLMVGKPEPVVYPAAFSLLDVAPARTLALGDALATDIAGAAAVGIDAVWVLGGIHAELAADLPAAAALAARAGLAPRATVPGFVW